MSAEDGDNSSNNEQDKVNMLRSFRKVIHGHHHLFYRLRFYLLVWSYIFNIRQLLSASSTFFLSFGLKMRTYCYVFKREKKNQSANDLHTFFVLLFVQDDVPVHHSQAEKLQASSHYRETSKFRRM